MRMKLETKYDIGDEVETILEFVVFDNEGKEIDRIDPVIDITITDKIYIDNSYCIYEYPLDTKYVVRVLDNNQTKNE